MEVGAQCGDRLVGRDGVAVSSRDIGARNIYIVADKDTESARSSEGAKQIEFYLLQALGRLAEDKALGAKREGAKILVRTGVGAVGKVVLNHIRLPGISKNKP